MGILGTLGLDDILGEVGKTVRQVLPNKEAQREFDIKMAELEDRAEARIAEHIQGQLDVNKAEAQHASVFVAGWRPFIGWVCGAGLAYNFVVNPALLAFGLANAALPIESLITLVVTMLGASGIRSYELSKGISRDTLKGVRLLPSPDSPVSESPQPAPASTTIEYQSEVPNEEENAPWNKR